MTEVAIPSINALIVHDGDGDRLFVKYYDGRTKAQQIEFEQLLQKKTKNIQAKSEAEILVLDNEVIVFKSGSDCRFYVVGSGEENELILSAVLESIFDSIGTLMKGQVEKRTMLDNLELVLLTIDETIDHGQIMELDSSSVVGRVLMRGSEQSSSHSQPSQSQSSGGDLTLSQAFGLARDSFFKTLGKEFLK
mmetsp:Transcript_9156/g.9905  ORF Transcript_9156/g.9905 Transcript_9156/m.9905 type:complete len:192 (+) Transcript_9156:108-683(+)|eukprot:CAMPEP_0173151236 /NCGR_PEP_ID=MMETSP1105-20130129/11451_1 /TAXON_ID=2985 /ORGANISM="Ochromonas sp., Strain BG-1" /LENGTH=191 /DNA_ID=CAMNT_0014066555 /DNA_START=83 /DNA_END=658 /DNA_ORIENTATION=+